MEQLTAQLQESEKSVEELQGKVNELADSFKRSLAEMENLRQRTSRQVENAHKFAVEVGRLGGGCSVKGGELPQCRCALAARLQVPHPPLLTPPPPPPPTLTPQPIIKSLLDVADNLQRAAEAVPAGAVDGSEDLDAERAQRLLKSLLQGLAMTEGVLMKVFQKHGVEQYNPAGEKFDPNLHQAMFEVPDGSKEAGVVAAVTKRGYRMHDRVLRAAEVGVYKAP